MGSCTTEDFSKVPATSVHNKDSDRRKGVRGCYNVQILTIDSDRAFPTTMSSMLVMIYNET